MDAPNFQTVAKTGPFTKFFIKIAGADEETLRLCPRRDWDSVRAVGEIMLCTWLYQTGLFFIISSRLFASPGQIRPELVLPSMFIATFILLIDAYMIMRSGWHRSGIEELKRGGLDISGGPIARIKAGIFLAIRILLSIGIAQLTALMLAILVFGPDIGARIHDAYLQANHGLIKGATALVDGEIQRATDAVTAESARHAALSAQVTALRQNEINPSANDPQIVAAQQEVTQLLAEKGKADDRVQAAEEFASNELAGIKGSSANSGEPGDGPRHKAAIDQLKDAKSHAQEVTRSLDAARGRLDALRSQTASANAEVMQRSRSQLPAFESAFAAESTTLAAMKDRLAALTQGRDEAIRHAVEKAPGYVELNHGLLAQITALEQIARGDTKIAAMILLTDLISFGFELAAVLAKVTSYVPTTYAAFLARDAYLGAVRIVDAMVKELDRGQRDANEPEIPLRAMPANQNGGGMDLRPSPSPSASPGDPSPTPAKRPRGRPRKYPLN